jgi:hypothetical protein
MTAILVVVRLPQHPVLRYGDLALPIVGAVMVMTRWYDGRGLRMASSPRTESPFTEHLGTFDPAA